MHLPAPLLAATLTVVLLGVAPPPAATAETDDQAVTWAVSPANAAGPDGRAWVEHTIDPGTTADEYLAVRNLGESAATFRLSAADGYFTATGRFNMLPSDQPSTGAGVWITVDPEVHVQAGETAIVPFTITVPAGATPGDHAAGVAASVLSTAANTGGNQIGVESRVGFRVITRVTGELTPALLLSGISADYSTSWNPFLPGRVVVHYTAENTGNTQLAFTDTINGSPDTERGDLLPGEKRAVTVDSITTWPLGLVAMELSIAATVPGEQSTSLEPTRESVVFWAIPWPQLVLLTGLALILAAIVGGRRRSRIKLDRLLEQARAQGREGANARSDAVG